MVGLAGSGRQSYRPVASPQRTAEGLDAAPQVPQPERGVDAPLEAGLLALAVAVSPFVLGWLLYLLLSTRASSFESALAVFLFGLPLMFVGAIVSLGVWGAVRARHRGGPMWPPLMITFVLFPVTFIAEFFFGYPVVRDNPAGYGWLAVGIGAGIFALGVWSSWSARRS
jgi:hypothetical protein